MLMAVRSDQWSLRCKTPKTEAAVFQVLGPHVFWELLLSADISCMPACATRSFRDL